MLKNKSQLNINENEIYNLLANQDYLKQYLDELSIIERSILKRLRQSSHSLSPEAIKSLANTLDFLQNQKERIIKILKEITTPPQETFTELPQQIKILLIINEFLSKTHNTSILDLLAETLQQKFNINITDLTQLTQINENTKH